MNITRTELPEVLIVEPAVHRDERGFFVETYQKRKFAAAVGKEIEFVQDNYSRSCRGVLRGIHFQLQPAAQGKLVRVTVGAVFDVAVDLRRSSHRFGHWIGVELSDSNPRQLWIPPGFGHGFIALSEYADLVYKVTDYYSPECEQAIRWDDPTLAIMWPSVGFGPIVSAKDQSAPRMEAARCFE